MVLRAIHNMVLKSICTVAYCRLLMRLVQYTPSWGNVSRELLKTLPDPAPSDYNRGEKTFSQPLKKFKSFSLTY